MIYRLFKTFFGSFIVALGIVVLLHAGLGADPLSVFLLGIMEQTGPFLGYHTFGTLSTTYGIVILLIVYFIDKTKIGIGSIINSLTVGIFINLLYSINADKWMINSDIFNIITGPIIIGIGLVIYLSANLGAGSTEAIMVIIDERSRISLKVIRILQDAIFVIVGLLLQAPFGWGIVTGVLLIGPTIEYTIKFKDRLKKEISK